MNYRRLWEKTHKCCLLPWVDIHHINGDRTDNRIENLQPVTIEEHYEIHLKQGDNAACQAILLRIKDRENISFHASLAQQERYANGTHNFQKISKERREEISSKAGKYTLEANLGIHALNKDKEAHALVSSAAGSRARDLKQGFHNPDKNGYNFVRQTTWWTHTETKQRVRSKSQPGPEWERGMK